MKAGQFQKNSAAQCISRFAPSPTGRLHMGHALSCAFAHGLARALGGQILLRIEDHDRTRCRPEFVAGIYEDLAWLGFDFDNQDRPGEAVPDTYVQSRCNARYRDAFEQVQAMGLTYPCACSRRDLMERGGKEAEVASTEFLPPLLGQLIYDSHCRLHPPATRQTPAVRMIFDSASSLPSRLALPTSWKDGLMPGDVSTFLVQNGDFLVIDKDGQWTYQFAVVADDLAHGITLVTRGADLLHTALRYAALWQALSERPLPSFAHHPLIIGEDGRKLSKAILSKPIAGFRAEGAQPDELLAQAFNEMTGLENTGLELADLARESAIAVRDLPKLFAELIR